MRARQLLKVGEKEVEEAERTTSHLDTVPHGLSFTTSARRDLQSRRVHFASARVKANKKITRSSATERSETLFTRTCEAGKSAKRRLVKSDALPSPLHQRAKTRRARARNTWRHLFTVGNPGHRGGEERRAFEARTIRGQTGDSKQHFACTARRATGNSAVAGKGK